MTFLTLSILNRHHEGKEVRVERPQFVIGRHRECQLRVSSPKVSAHHCVLVLRDNGAWVRDMDSTNGTYVNEERVAGERRLAAGDRLRIGPMLLGVRHIGWKELGVGEQKRARKLDESDAVALLLAPSKARSSGGLLGLGEGSGPSETVIDLPPVR